MEEDPDYRNALAEEGLDPDDPKLRSGIANVVSMLRCIGDHERAYPTRTPDDLREALEELEAGYVQERALQEAADLAAGD